MKYLNRVNEYPFDTPMKHPFDYDLRYGCRGVKCLHPIEHIKYPKRTQYIPLYKLLELFIIF